MTDIEFVATFGAGALFGIVWGFLLHRMLIAKQVDEIKRIADRILKRFDDQHPKEGA